MNQTPVFKATHFSLPFKVACYIYEFLNYGLLKWRLALQFYYYTNKDLLDLINNLRIKRDLLLTIPESLQLFELAKSALKIPGDFAEVGVYRGGSAKLIAKIKGNKMLHLFDTFNGLPRTTDNDRYFITGEYSSSLLKVKKILKGCKKIKFYPGLFPESAKNLKNIQFAFVHLDVDLYQSTLSSLSYFYPNMSKGGIILCHDYPISYGVKKALDEFFNQRPEVIIKMVGNQGLIVKL